MDKKTSTRVRKMYGRPTLLHPKLCTNYISGRGFNTIQDVPLPKGDGGYIP